MRRNMYAVCPGNGRQRQAWFPKGPRAATSIIAKSNFKQTRQPTDMVFAHACSRSLQEVKETGGFDPA